MRRLPLFVLAAGLLSACSRHPRATPVEEGNRDGILHLGNATEPRELDPQLTTGIYEGNIERALYEPLVNYDGKDVHPVPGVAQSWDVAPDGLAYTFHLRPDAKWSNGAPVTAQDYVRSFQRALSPRLGAEFSYFLWVLKNAQKFDDPAAAPGDFSQVGAHALDEHTLRLELEHPAPYFLNLIAGRTWYPVYLPAIEKGGAIDDRGNQGWTRPGATVGNGPFVLTEWSVNRRIVVKKNPLYWDAARVRLNEIDFYPIDNLEAEERAFRAGQVHKTSNVPAGKIDVYRREQPALLHVPAYMGSYYFMLNITRAPLDDVRVRDALSMTVDRASIVRNVTRAGQGAASTYVPPGLGGYACSAPVPYDPEGARGLLAAAGHPGGAGLAPIDLIFNTSEMHRQIAEAVQQMWRKELGVTVNLHNEEWKVYLADRRAMNYTMARAGWIATYLDPLAFLENFLAGGSNNNTGFASAEYDRLIAQSHRETDPATRNRDLSQAEAILLQSAAVIPVFYYTNPYLIAPSVRGWDDNLLDYHPYQDVSLQP